MYEFIEGEFVEKSPAHLIVSASHLAYYINISVFTYSQVSSQTSGRIYLHFVVREDAQVLYGFSGREEREIFRSLISVSGVGANTARLILIIPVARRGYPGHPGRECICSTGNQRDRGQIGPTDYRGPERQDRERCGNR